MLRERSRVFAWAVTTWVTIITVKGYLGRRVSNPREELWERGPYIASTSRRKLELSMNIAVQTSLCIFSYAMRAGVEPDGIYHLRKRTTQSLPPILITLNPTRRAGLLLNTLRPPYDQTQDTVDQTPRYMQMRNVNIQPMTSQHLCLSSRVARWRLSVHPNQAQELIASLGLAFEATKHAAGYRSSGGLLNAAHDHTEVAGLHDDSNALRLEGFHDGVGDFFGETFLDLQATREHVCDAGEFGYADDIVFGNVADVHLVNGGVRLSSQ